MKRPGTGTGADSNARQGDRPASTRSSSRRSVLLTAGTSTVGALAGCLGRRKSVGDSGGTEADGTPLADHPAATGLADQPAKGRDPTETDAVIVAFEDPSCPRCRVFELETVPKIESELVEPGVATFVFRGYPVIYPWGEPATHALEATFGRAADAFWALKDHYYAEQSSFSTDNVLDRTRSFLATETVVDADAVIEAVESGATDPAVEADLDAGMAAGAGRTTPHVFLFRDGRYVTKAAGSVSFSVVKNALGL